MSKYEYHFNRYQLNIKKEEELREELAKETNANKKISLKYALEKVAQLKEKHRLAYLVEAKKGHLKQQECRLVEQTILEWALTQGNILVVCPICLNPIEKCDQIEIYVGKAYHRFCWDLIRGVNPFIAEELQVKNLLTEHALRLYSQLHPADGDLILIKIDSQTLQKESGMTSMIKKKLNKQMKCEGCEAWDKICDGTECYLIQKEEN